MKRDVSMDRLRAVRLGSQQLIHKLPNVVGTAIGGKVAGGIFSGKRSIIVYVSRKLDEGLDKTEIIPRYIEIKKFKVPTDVVEISSLREQYGPPPHFCRDGSRIGTVTAMCKSGRSIFGGTCAHNLKGPDLDIYTRDRMELFNSTLNMWTEIGDTNFVQYSSGFGMPGNYGFTDAGLFTIEDDELIRKCLISDELGCWDRVRVGTKVRAKVSNNRLITGIVVHVEGNFNALYADVCVKVDPPGTYAGDSGILWRTDSGLAVAVHARGSGDFGDGGARYSFGMFAHRMRQVLGVDFLDA